MTLPWFRFYSEALRDRKLEYACRAAGQPKHAMIALWTALLCLANESPKRGTLLVAEGMPVTVSVIAGELEMPEQTIIALLDALEQLRRIERYNGTITISNWDKRQFASDDVTARTRRYRQRHQRNVPATLQQHQRNVPATLQQHQRNVPATLQQRLPERYGNSPDTDTESERDTDTESEAERSPQTPQTDQSETDELWERISDALRLQMTQAMHDQWIRPAKLVSVDQGQVVIGFPQAAAAEAVRKRLGRLVIATIGRELGRDVAVEYEVMA